MKFPEITQKTRLGMTLWGICIVIILLTPRIIRYWTPAKPFNIQRYQSKEIERFEERAKLRFASRIKKVQPAKYQSPPCRFNPNHYKLEEWIYLGLSNKQAAAVLKFCRFPLRSNTDLKKIFTIPLPLFLLIKDSTYYDAKPKMGFSKHENTQKKEPVIQQISLATIDSAQLVALPGIGPFFAKMVMRYEKALGGFHAKEQLLEVYKMNEDVYAILCKYLDFNQKNIRKISINLATKEDLAKHPYIDNWQANSIVKMRKQLGGFRELQELLDSHLINIETFEKVLPYVSL